MKKIPEMITALVLCVCFVLLCGIAGAEEIHVLGSGNWDDLDYQFTLPDESYGSRWKLVVDTHNPDGPELNYEAGFAITAQSRSFMLLMSEDKPEQRHLF